MARFPRLLLPSLAFLGACSALVPESLRLRMSVVGGRELKMSDDLSRRTVALIINEEGEGEEICSAVLIAEDIALTAAHCIRTYALHARYRVVFGLDANAEDRVERRVLAVSAHPGWDFTSIEEHDLHDIGLVRFDGGLPEGFVVSPVLETRDALVADKLVEIAGYGLSNPDDGDSDGLLRGAEVPVLDPAFSRTEVSLDNSRGRGACHGDSGGPAFVRVDGVPHVWGVISRGEMGCDKTTVYTFVAHYAEYVRETTLALREVETLIGDPPKIVGEFKKIVDESEDEDGAASDVVDPPAFDDADVTDEVASEWEGRF